MSLDAKVKEKLMNERKNPSENIFDEAQSKIYSLMHRDSFARCNLVPRNKKYQQPVSFFFRFLVSDYYMKLKGEKNRGKSIDVIVADNETSETTDSADILGDQSETNSKAPPALEMTAAGPEVVLRQVSCQTQKALDELQTQTLDYETEKLLLFSK